MLVHYEARPIENDITLGALTGQLNLGSKLMEDVEEDIKSRIQNGSRRYILDLTNLAYIDSGGLGMIVACAGAMSRAGGKLVVVNPGGKITHMFEITHLDTVISLYTSIDAACQALAPPAETPKS